MPTVHSGLLPHSSSSFQQRPTSHGTSIRDSPTISRCDALHADEPCYAAHGDGGRDEGDLGSRGSAPAAVWPVVAGVVRYTLPGHASYAVGSATHPQVDALSKLRGETWGVLMGAFPQIVGVGEPTEGRVLVEIVCSPHRPREEALNAHLASPGQ